MLNFIHRLFNPHCPDCIAAEEAKKVCNTCEILQHELDLLRNERDKLLNRIIAPEIQVQGESKVELHPITSHRIPFAVRRQMLENESRQAAKLLRDKEKEIAEASKIKTTNTKELTTEEIEKELGVEEAG